MEDSMAADQQPGVLATGIVEDQPDLLEGLQTMINGTPATAAWGHSAAWKRRWLAWARLPDALCCSLFPRAVAARDGIAIVAAVTISR